MDFTGYIVFYILYCINIISDESNTYSFIKILQCKQLAINQVTYLSQNHESQDEKRY